MPPTSLILAAGSQATLLAGGNRFMTSIASLAQTPDDVIEIAHYAPVRVFSHAIWKLLMGVGALATTLLVPWFVFVVEPETGPGVVLIALLPLLYTLTSLPFGIRALLGAFAKNCYIRANHAGVEIRFPDYYFHWRSLNFRHRVLEYDFPWKKISGWHLFTYKVNGMTVSKSLVIETTTGSLEVERFWFKESSQDIMDGLAAAQLALRMARAGKPHREYPNTVWGEDGDIWPAAEFEWADSTAGSYAVRFKLAGQPHPDYPNVVWNAAGKVDPASGFTWVGTEGFNVVPTGNTGNLAATSETVKSAAN